ncbi:putative RNA-directed DNA polymerase [Helianthus annuus]|nr:putative RNA-directed DNA polymerase [Helianthus annuus]
MVDETPSSANKTTTDKQPLHPAYTVTNINNKIRTLDGKTVTYSAWVKLFKLHVRAYKVLHHIDGSDPPAETDPTYSAWSELDALILQWIYSTLSDDLLARVLNTDLTARATWLKIQDIFINNKHARAATLENKFTNTTLSSCSSFDDYCQTLKNIAEQLGDVDQPVTESRLVIQMVRGLPIEYDTIGAIINQSKPSWDAARGMIEDEQQRQSARTNSNRETVLLNSNQSSTPDSVRSPYPNGYRGKNYDPVKAARGRGQPGRGGRHPGRGDRLTNGANTSRGSTSWGQPQQYQPSMFFSPQPNNQPSWTPPPTPYPSHPAHYNPHNQAHVAQQDPMQPSQQTHGNPSQAHIAHQSQYSPPPGFGSTDGNALCPSDIGMALSTLSLNYNDPQWYMDTGASSHITSDQGPQGWAPAFPPQ